MVRHITYPRGSQYLPSQNITASPNSLWRTLDPERASGSKSQIPALFHPSLSPKEHCQWVFTSKWVISSVCKSNWQQCFHIQRRNRVESVIFIFSRTKRGDCIIITQADINRPIKPEMRTWTICIILQLAANLAWLLFFLPHFARSMGSAWGHSNKLLI